MFILKMSSIFLAFFSFVQLFLLLAQERTVCTEFFLLEKLFGLLFWKNNYTDCPIQVLTLATSSPVAMQG